MADIPLVGGAKAIASPSGPMIAVPLVIKDELGQLKTVYIDTQTGSIIQNPTGYTIVSAGNNVPNLPDVDLSKLGLDKGKSTSPLASEDDVLNEKSMTDRVREAHGGGRLQAGPTSSGNRGSLNPANNFGYISKNSLVGKALSVLGGAIIGGPAAKAIDIGVNMHNEEAAETARKMLGIDPPSVAQSAKNVWSGNKGQIGEIDIGNKTYNVGFEAMSPDEKTNLTPTEANNRQNLAKAQAAAVTNPSTTTNAPGISTNKNVGKFTEKAIDASFGKVPDNVGAGTSPKTSKLSAGVTPTSVNPMGTSKTKETTKAAIDAATGADVGFVGNFGQNRPNKPGKAVVDTVKDAVAKTFGKGATVVGTSGTEDAGHQHGSKRHKTGKAMDFDVVDSTGKMATDDQMKDLAGQVAYDNPKAGIGYGKGYMTPGRMHVDVTNLGTTDPAHYGNQWGAKNTRQNMDPALDQTLSAARLGYKPTPFSNPPTPSPNPGPEVSKSFVSQDERTTPGALDPVGDDLDPTSNRQANTTPSAIGNLGKNTTKSISKSTPAPTGTATVGRAMTPAEAANKGFIGRTPAEKKAMAQTIAGELSPGSLKALQQKDPAAIAEFSNMMATIENRAATKQFKSIPGTLTPSQYNSLMDSNKKVTNANYAKYKAALDDAVDKYYGGTYKPTNPAATNYYNPDIANPGWGPKMTNMTQNNEHVFGTLPGYKPGPDYANSMWGDKKSFMNANTGTFGTRQSPGFNRSNLGNLSNANANRSAFGNPGSPDDRGGFAAAARGSGANTNRGAFGNPGGPDDRGTGGAFGNARGGGAVSGANANRGAFGNPGGPDDRGTGGAFGNAARGGATSGANANRGAFGNPGGPDDRGSSNSGKSGGGMNTSGAQSGANAGKGKTEKGSSSGGGHWGA